MQFFPDQGVINFLERIATQLEKPFYLSSGFWAVIVALSIPFLVEYLRRIPNKSNLIISDIIVINQDNNPDEQHKPKLLDIARLAIRNEGRFKALSVEAYIEKICEDGEVRKDFIPMPLSWTHGQLNKSGPAVRDIYPNQTVLLDILQNTLDPEYVGDRSVRFAVAAGQNIDTLSKLALGESEVLIKIYQESGQVNDVLLKMTWDAKNNPQVSIIR
jgi:hypothetical protein